MTTKAKIQMKANKDSFAQEFSTDTEGNIRKMVINFHDYQHLPETTEDEALILAMKKVQDETPLHLNKALA
jgi:hypothetical protein